MYIYLYVCVCFSINIRSAITAENLSSDAKLILEEITRCLNLEKLLPCYKYTVTVACLKAIRKLQKFGHLPNHPALFRSYAAYGQYIGTCMLHFKSRVAFTTALFRSRYSVSSTGGASRLHQGGREMVRFRIPAQSRRDRPRPGTETWTDATDDL